MAITRTYHSTLDDIRTFYVQSFPNLLLKIVVLFICCYNGNTRLNYVNSRLTSLIRDLLKSQTISCQLDFNSYFPLHFCNLHPHPRTICGTNDTSCNVTGCSNPNAQTFPGNSLSNYFRLLLIFYITNIFTKSLPLPCYLQLISKS